MNTGYSMRPDRLARELERDLLALAKEVATLDLLSNGRVLLGIGVGWNAEELANHQPNLPFNRRYGAMKERIAALKSLWTEDVTTFEGRYVAIKDVVCLPKPVQKPHPPVIMGAWGEIGRRHAGAQRLPGRLPEAP